MGVRTAFCIWAILPFFKGESSSDSQCSRSGENVYLHLQNENTNFKDLSWAFSNENNSNSVVATFKRNFKSSVELFQNGTLKINNIQTNWSGEFTATGYNRSGANTVKEAHRLLILDRPTVEFLLCSNGRSMFYCVNENGQDVTYSWTVSNSVLGEQTVFSNSCKHVFLKDMSGTVRCSVEKKGCSVQSEPQNFSCPKHLFETAQRWCVSVLISVSALLLCLTVAGLLICIRGCYKKRHLNENTAESSSSPEATSHGLIFYSEVRLPR